MKDDPETNRRRYWSAADSGWSGDSPSSWTSFRGHLRGLLALEVLVRQDLPWLNEMMHRFPSDQAERSDDTIARYDEHLANCLGAPRA